MHQSMFPVYIIIFYALYTLTICKYAVAKESVFTYSFAVSIILNHAKNENLYYFINVLLSIIET